MIGVDRPLDVTIRRSRRLIGLVAAVHCVAFVTSAGMAIGRPVFLLVAAAVVGSMVQALRPNKIERLRVGPNKQCRVWSRDCDNEIGVIHQSTVLGATAVVLTLAIREPAARTRHVLIDSDAVDAIDFRLLRAHLRVANENDRA